MKGIPGQFCTDPAHARCNTEASHPHSSSIFSTFITVLEKISAVALGVFAAYTNLELFLPFFLFGVAVGIYNYFAQVDSCHKGHSVSSCSLGSIEQLTGVKLPPLLSLAATVGALVCHIDHHDTIFVPIVATSLGAWAGTLISEAGDLLYRKFTCHQQCAHAH